MADARLTLTIDNRRRRVARDTTVVELLEAPPTGDPSEPLAAIYNNRLVSLSYRLRSGGTLRWVTRQDRAGWDVYRRSACLMLYEAAHRLDPKWHLVLHQTHGDGLYFEAFKRGRGGEELPVELGPDVGADLDREMRALVAQGLPFEVRRISVDEARASLKTAGRSDKLNLLHSHWETSVRVVTLGGFLDLFHNPVALATDTIREFKLQAYDRGLLLRLPTRGAPKVRGRARVSPLLFSTHTEARGWNRQLGVANVGELNALSLSGRRDEAIHALIRVAEGGHEKRIASIAHRIAHRPKPVRLVLAAGPSSSGKTTFIKRLAVQLQVNGVQPVTLSVDDFFVARDRTPLDAQGELDFEVLEALDLKLFNRVLGQLMERGWARVPRFDFNAGAPTPRASWERVELGPEQVLLVEGIHGLNPRLTPAVPPRHKFKIYISALTQLSLDNHNRIFTSDTRLLRRIVRDRRYRGYSAADTISRWPSVRRGEMQHIFPFQDEADEMFNSALVYEHAVLRSYAERFLLEVDPQDPAFPEAYRLLGFLRLLVPVFRDAVPHNSLLREFVGGSAFNY